MKSRVLAKRYARALFAQAVEDKKTEGLEAELAGLVALTAESAEFGTLVKSPLISLEEKLAVLDKLKSGKKISDLVYAFLKVLSAKNRLYLLAEVAEEVSELAMQSRGEVKGVATFAADVDDSILAELAKVMQSISGQKVSMSKKVDPAILGGMKINLGGSLYDASVRGQLDKLQESLAE